MKINIEKNLAEFIPQTPEESSQLEKLWRMMVDCNGTNKKMAPVGEFVPTRHNKAGFLIEGIEVARSAYPQIAVESDCRVCCTICNKMLDLKKGDIIPPCCGKLMDVVD